MGRGEGGGVRRREAGFTYTIRSTESSKTGLDSLTFFINTLQKMRKNDGIVLKCSTATSTENFEIKQRGYPSAMLLQNSQKSFV